MEDVAMSGADDFDWESTWAQLETGSEIREKALSAGTKETVQYFRGWFERFNQDVLHTRHQRTAQESLKLITAPEIQLYLLYRIKTCTYTKKNKKIRRSTVQSWYKTFQMVFFLDTQNTLPRTTNITVNKFIETTLTSKFGLLMDSKDKPTCCVTDLFNLLYYHWCQDDDSTCHGRYRVQVAFLMQLIAYTSTRPGSIIEANCYKGTGQVLKYKDMRLSLLRDPIEGGSVLVLEVTTTFLKGKRNKREPVTYVLYERQDHPIFCPVMNLLALAFADNAFKEGGIKNPEDLHNLEIPSFKESLLIQWKPDILDTPLFRRQVGGTICSSSPMAYSDFNYYLGRLGVLAGYPQHLTTYVLRRGAANAVDCPEVTDVQRNQIMGHARADVFRRHYLHQNVKVDTQSLYLGTVNRADLIRSVGLMSARRDPRAPVKVDLTQLDINNHPEIASLKRSTDQLRISLQKRARTLKAAKTQFPDEFKAYTSARTKLNSRKKAITRAKLVETRRDWFEAVDHQEIKQQLQGSRPSEFSYAKPEFNCALRDAAAEFHKSPSDMSWADAVRTLASLCLQKAPIHNKAGGGTTICPFCLADDSLRASDRMHAFQSDSTLRRHIDRRHGAQTGSSETVLCPYQGCNVRLDNGEHLKSHIFTVHNFTLSA